MTRTILIVDDDPMIRQLIATTLEDVSGYRLQEAGDGAGGGRARRRRRGPEIVFLDIDMPRLNGIEACRRLRSRPGDGGRDDRDAHRRLRRRRPSAAPSDAGADLFLTKPFSPLHLLRLVDRIGAAR